MAVGSDPPGSIPGASQDERPGPAPGNGTHSVLRFAADLLGDPDAVIRLRAAALHLVSERSPRSQAELGHRSEEGWGSASSDAQVIDRASDLIPKTIPFLGPEL